MGLNNPPGGRPPELTEELLESIIADIAAAIPYEYAAEANGICEKTLYNWKNHGIHDRAKGLDTIFSRFLQGIKSAERNRIKKHLNNLDNHVDDWTADAWILERRWWKHFSKNVPLLELQKQMDEMRDQMEKDNGKAESRNKE